MLTVFKYNVPITDMFGLEMPEGAEILHFGTQKGKPQLWIKVDTDANLTTRAFRLVGTGHDLVDMMPTADLKYIGTVNLHDDDLIFHLFEVIYRK